MTIKTSIALLISSLACIGADFSLLSKHNHNQILSYAITADRAELLPEWSGENDTPFSFAKSISAANEYIKQIHPGKHYMLVDVDLDGKMFERKKIVWAYRFEFKIIGERDSVVVMILMDGSKVEPKVTPRRE